MKKTRTGEWFECKVRYNKLQEDGTTKNTTEAFVVEALSFAEAEGNAIGKASNFVSGELFVKDIKRAAYKEIFFNDDADKYFKVKVAFSRIQDNGKMKVTVYTYLVQANSNDEAHKYTHEVMNEGMEDYEIKDVTSTHILDVFEYTSNND